MGSIKRDRATEKFEAAGLCDPGLRWRLLRPEVNRRSSLAAYHSGNSNARRRARERTIEKAYRGVFKWRLYRLEKAARRAFSRKPVKYSPEERKIVRALHRRFHKAKGNRGSSAFIFELCGISVRGLREHLESLFKPGMSWENYGIDGWHIDHKRPCASFNLTCPEQQRVCFHFSNLQPLWAKENMEKGARMPVDIARCPAHTSGQL